MSGLLVTPFPEVGEHMKRAYYDLFRAETAEKLTQVADLGPLDQLPRPWEVASVTDFMLRAEIWDWLDRVVGWINRECAWETSDLIPPCWPQHPHLVHELGVVADQRRRAGMAFTSDNLEDWHRYCLPSFVDRMKARYRGFCEDGHQSAPGTARNSRYDSTAAFGERNDHYADDSEALYNVVPPAPSQPAPGSTRTNLRLVDGALVDPETGEIIGPR